MRVKSIIDSGKMSVSNIRTVIKCMATDTIIPARIQQAFNKHYKLSKAVIDVNFMAELSEQDILNANIIEGKNIMY